jgi:hypothetical protein
MSKYLMISLKFFGLLKGMVEKSESHLLGVRFPKCMAIAI